MKLSELISTKLISAVITALIVSAFVLQGCGGGTGSAKTAAGIIEEASFVSIASGDRIYVSDFEGKVVLVDFWETWCVPCLNSMPTFQQILDEQPDRFVVLAVSPGWSDTAEDVRNFMGQHDYDFVFVMDEDEITTQLGISGIPYKVFVGPDGKYITTEMGSRGQQRDYAKIMEILNQYNPPQP